MLLRTTLAVSLFGLMVIAGCDLLPQLFPDGPGGETGPPQLKAFSSQSEFEAYFKGQIAQRNSAYTDFNRQDLEEVGDSTGLPGTAPQLDADGAAEAPPSPAPGDDFSGTTIQEVGVDEADVLKTDGSFFYMIDTDADGDGSILRIVRAVPADQLGVISEIDLDGYGRDLYLREGKIVAITSGGGYYFYPLGIEDGVAVDPRPTDGGSSDADAATGAAEIGIAPPFGGDDFVYERPHTLVTIVDISDTAQPRVLSQTKFDGTQSATRMINGVLHMVVANYQDYYFDVLPMLGRPELNVAEVNVQTLLPEFERIDADGSESAGSVVTWENLYHPADPDGFGVVTLVSLDVDNNARFTAVGVVAEPGLIYSSTEALYLTNTTYDFSGNARTTTNVYKFDYENRGATPVAAGAVPGRILNQYSMGEHQGNLRVATTIDATWVCGFFDCQRTDEGSNAVYVLGQSADTLTALGSVENIAPRETIQSARFIGDRGYLVTFEQIDPLFTLDLSDPANPRVVGELEVPGFSTFLVPMDGDHILAVGQYVPPPDTPGNWGVQLSIFDVSDFANPVRTSNVILDQANSEATWDPKAFTYFASQGLVALPLSIYDSLAFDGDGGIADDVTTIDADADGSVGVEPDAEPPPAQDATEPIKPEGFEGLVVFRATVDAGLVELGRISTRFDESGGYYWGSSFTRGVFIGDKVYAVTSLGIRESAVANVSVVENEAFYGQIFEPAPPIEPEPVPPTEPVEPLDPGTPPSPGTGNDGSSGAGQAVP